MLQDAYEMYNAGRIKCALPLRRRLFPVQVCPGRKRRGERHHRVRDPALPPRNGGIRIFLMFNFSAIARNAISTKCYITKLFWAAMATTIMFLLKQRSLLWRVRAGVSSGNVITSSVCSRRAPLHVVTDARLLEAHVLHIVSLIGG